MVESGAADKSSGWKSSKQLGCVEKLRYLLFDEYNRSPAENPNRAVWINNGTMPEVMLAAGVLCNHFFFQQ
jgi:hypothetical protein